MEDIKIGKYVLYKGKPAWWLVIIGSIICGAIEVYAMMFLGSLILG